MRVVGLLLDSCDCVLPLLRSSALGERWAQQSALDRWSNAGLAGHLARSAFNLERTVGRQHQDGPVLDAVSYYAAPDSPETGKRIRELGDQEAADGPRALADRFAASTTWLREHALPLDPATTVGLFGRVLPIDECATACLLELVVHADDVAVSVGLEPVEFSDLAVDLVVGTLSRISRRRHGDLAVIRGLSRPERAPAQGISAF